MTNSYWPLRPFSRETDLPHYDTLPRWLRVIGRIARMSSYLFVALVGIGDALYGDGDTFSDNAVDVWSLAMSALAIAGFMSVLLHKWRWEWVISFWLAALVCLRSVFVWATPGPPPPITNGSLTTCVAVFLFLRGIDLTVFAVRSSDWKIRLRRA